MLDELRVFVPIYVKQLGYVDVTVSNLGLNIGRKGGRTFWSTNVELNIQGQDRWIFHRVYPTYHGLHPLLQQAQALETQEPSKPVDLVGQIDQILIQHGNFEGG